MDLKEQYILADQVASHWYYHSKAQAIARLISSRSFTRVLDVGAGSGFFSRHLLANTDAIEAYCLDTSYSREYSDTFRGKSIHFVRSLNSLEAEMVLLMDVLEHVDDDIGLLAENAAKVPLGSSFVITVPAFAFLWSQHDEFLGHRRRYTLKQMCKVVEEAGLELKQGLYYFAGVLPIAMLARSCQNLFRRQASPRSQLTRHSPVINQFLKAVCQAELVIMRQNRLAGLSVLCLAEKV